MGYVKLWDNVLDNIKVQRLTPDVFKAWVNLLAVTARYGGPKGELPTWDDMLFGLRSDRATIQGWIKALVTSGLIDRNGSHYSLHDFEKWNESRDKTAAKRQKEWRERNASRNALRNGVTAPQHNTPQELEGNEGLEGLEGGKGESPPPPLGSPPEIEDEWATVADSWVATGADLEPFDPGPPEKPAEPLSPELQKVFDAASSVGGDVGWGVWAVNRIKLGDKPEWIEPALRRAVDQGALRTSYVGGVLEGFRREGGPRPATIPINGRRRDGPTNMPPEIPPDTRTPEEKAELTEKYRRHLDECRRRGQQGTV